MIAKYSSYTEARAYTWPVLEEQPPFESPVGASPPLTQKLSIAFLAYLACLALDHSRGISIRIHCRERNAAIEDLEIWLVCQHQVPFAVVRRGLGKTNNRIMGDDGTTFEGGWLAEGRCYREGGRQQWTKSHSAVLSSLVSERLAVPVGYENTDDGLADPHDHGQVCERTSSALSKALCMAVDVTTASTMNPYLIH